MLEPEVESRPWAEQQALDADSYAEQLAYLLERSRFYREKLGAAGIETAGDAVGLNNPNDHLVLANTAGATQGFITNPVLADGTTQAAVLDLHEGRESVWIPLPERPVRLRIDPEFHAFRRLTRERLAPMLNLFVTDRERVLVLPGEGAEAERAPYRELAARIAAQDSVQGSSQTGHAAGTRQVPDRDAIGPGGAVLVPGSVLVLGGPGVNRAAGWAVRGCGEGLSVERDRFTVGGRSYEGADTALLVSCRRPDQPGHVVTLFYGLSPQAAAKVARLLFFYGWQSYLVFRDGTVVARGDVAPAEDEGEVVFDER